MVAEEEDDKAIPESKLPEIVFSVMVAEEKCKKIPQKFDEIVFSVMVAEEEEATIP